MEYIEDNLIHDIDYTIIAKIMNCSEWEIRRMFSFLSQMSLSEYIPNRRLTEAADDIKRCTKNYVNKKYISKCV